MKKYNNRKFLSGLIIEAGISEELITDTITIIDKFEKLTKEELHKVLEMGSDFIQGFYYSKPLPFNEITDYLKNFKKII